MIHQEPGCVPSPEQALGSFLSPESSLHPARRGGLAGAGAAGGSGWGLSSRRPGCPQVSPCSHTGLPPSMAAWGTRGLPGGSRAPAGVSQLTGKVTRPQGHAVSPLLTAVPAGVSPALLQVEGRAGPKEHDAACWGIQSSTASRCRSCRVWRWPVSRESEMWPLACVGNQGEEVQGPRYQVS